MALAHKLFVPVLCRRPPSFERNPLDPRQILSRFGHVVSALGWGTHALAPLSFRAGTYSGVFTLLPRLCLHGRVRACRSRGIDGRRATTHWAHARNLQKRYPAIKVEDDRIFITDGPVWTSAGITAGIDLALSMGTA